MTRECADCHATPDVAELRFVRLLTAPDCWLCVDADACRARMRARREAKS